MKILALLILATLPVCAAAAPVLHSRPRSPHTFYLDTDGEPAELWGTRPIPATPAYVGDAAKVWAVVAEAFAPFDVDVTNVDPGPLVNDRSYKVVIGGDGAWNGTSGSGVTLIGSFYSDDPNVDYVFPGLLGNDPTQTGRIAVHELGHALGLQHQSLYAADGTPIAEYNPGDALLAPYMGDPRFAAKAAWWDGPNVYGREQDDAALIGGRIGYAPVGEPGTALAVCGVVVVGCRRRRRN